MHPLKFTPHKGQRDYTNVKRAPVINCVVRYQGKILLVHRSANLAFYPEYWHCISGFLDDHSRAREKALQELKEETGISSSGVVGIHEGTPFEQKSREYDKTWIVHPILIDVLTDKITLDWEADDYQWVEPKRIENFSMLPGFDKVLKALHL